MNQNSKSDANTVQKHCYVYNYEKYKSHYCRIFLPQNGRHQVLYLIPLPPCSLCEAAVLRCSRQLLRQDSLGFQSDSLEVDFELQMSFLQRQKPLSGQL